MSGYDNGDDDRMDAKDVFKSVKWWIAALLAFLVIIAFAFIQNARQPRETAKKASAYTISRSEAAKIKAGTVSMIKECGTWGVTDKVTEGNASEIYDEARMYSLDAGRLSDGHAGYILSRHDHRGECLARYVTQDSSMQGFTPDWSDRDAMMSYSVDDESLDISDPRAAKVVMDGNSRPKLTLKASWTYHENGLYPLFRHTGGNPKAEYDLSINGKTEWRRFSVNHEMKDVLIDMELEDGSWKVSSIHGGDWKDFGYGNVLADNVSYSDGAKRVQTPWEDGSQRQ